MVLSFVAGLLPARSAHALLDPVTPVVTKIPAGGSPLAGSVVKSAARMRNLASVASSQGAFLGKPDLGVGANRVATPTGQPRYLVGASTPNHITFSYSPVLAQSTLTIQATATHTLTYASGSLGPLSYVRIDIYSRAADPNTNGGAWSAMSAGDGVFDEQAEDVSAVFTPAQPGQYEVCVRAADVEGNLSGETCVIVAVWKAFWMPILMLE